MSYGIDIDLKNEDNKNKCNSISNSLNDIY